MRAPLRGVENKSAFDLVTETDKKSEELVLGHLKRCFPSHKFIGEESADADVVLTDEPTWMVDPLDGTTNLHVPLSYSSHSSHDNITPLLTFFFDYR